MAKKIPKKVSNSEKVKVLIQITRPVNVLMVAFAIVIAVLAVLGNFGPLNITIPAILAAALVAAGGNALNDYYDEAIDLVNQPKRALPSGKITPVGLWVYASTLFFIGILLAVIFLPFISILIAFINSILLALYASKLKKSGFIGNLVISYLVASVFVFGGAAVGKIVIGVILAIAAFFANAAREVLKDLEDVRGDEAFGAKTLATEEGTRKSLIVAASFIITAILVSPIPYLLHILSIYYMVLAIAADLLLAYVIVSMLRKRTITSMKANQKRIKIAAGIALIAFFIGALL